MAIYTKTGDKGTTALFGGEVRRKKYDLRVSAYGTVDEVNSQIGVVLAFLEVKEVKNWLKEIQKDLFEIASELATDPKTNPPFSLKRDRIKFLEGIVDQLEGSLPALGNFIFPGGSKPGSLIHIARTICRRAEREIVKLADKEEVNSNIVIYMNRLSDTLFMLARRVNHDLKSPEEIWKK
jgi:cob(I)alamin adenosyltransferase